MPRRFFLVELHESFQRALGVDESNTIIFDMTPQGTSSSVVPPANQVGARLARLLLTVETLAKTFSWFARVPSPSNLADELFGSRL